MRYRGQIFLLFPGIIHSLVLWNINHSELCYCYRFGSCKISLKNFTLTVDQLAKISILRKHCRNFWLPYWGLIGRDLFINCISSQSLEFSFPSYEQTLKKILRLILYGAGRRPLATSLLAWLLCGLQYYKKLAPLIQKLVRSTCSKSKLCSVCM